MELDLNLGQHETFWSSFNKDRGNIDYKKIPRRLQ